jgi:hypothetical protein
MINLRFLKVPGEHVASLRDWMHRSTERVEELKATMRDEGVTEECVALVPLPGSTDALLVYAVACDDHAAALEVFGRSTHPIDEEHRVAMAAAELVPLPAEELLRAVVGT